MQAYPAMEYRFTPERISVTTDDVVCFVWSGEKTLFEINVSDYHKGGGKQGQNVADTLLRTQMFPCFPPGATFVADTQFACVRDTKSVSDFFQKHFVSATNVSRFSQHRNRKRQS